MSGVGLAGRFEQLLLTRRGLIGGGGKQAESVGELIIRMIERRAKSTLRQSPPENVSQVIATLCVRRDGVRKTLELLWQVYVSAHGGSPQTMAAPEALGVECKQTHRSEILRALNRVLAEFERQSEDF